MNWKAPIPHIYCHLLSWPSEMMVSLFVLDFCYILSHSNTSVWKPIAGNHSALHTSFWYSFVVSWHLRWWVCLHQIMCSTGINISQIQSWNIHHHSILVLCFIPRPEISGTISHGDKLIVSISTTTWSYLSFFSCCGSHIPYYFSWCSCLPIYVHVCSVLTDAGW